MLAPAKLGCEGWGEGGEGCCLPVLHKHAGVTALPPSPSVPISALSAPRHLVPHPEQVVQDDALKEELRKRQAYVTRCIVSAAQLISEKIDRGGFMAGYDWCVDEGRVEGQLGRAGRGHSIHRNKEHAQLSLCSHCSHLAPSMPTRPYHTFLFLFMNDAGARSSCAARTLCGWPTRWSWPRLPSTCPTRSLRRQWGCSRWVDRSAAYLMRTVRQARPSSLLVPSYHRRQCKHAQPAVI